MRLPDVPPDLSDELAQAVENGRLQRILEITAALVPTTYVHWDELRHRPPPADLTVHEWWLGLRWGRQSQLRELPLRSSAGRPFRYGLPDRALQLVHIVDQRASGEIVMSEVVSDPATRRRYLVDSLMEEAIASSQLEGASTTRKVAKEMLRTGRKPRDIGEQMILNNYAAISRIRELKDQPLTPSVVLELHRTMTWKTLDDPAAAGRLQEPEEERVKVIDPADGTVLHEPPPAEELPARLQALCDFANQKPPEPFIHPVIRAVIVHLWLAYDHPFQDGNGRTARALFYWTMASQGYWLTEYLSISRLLNAAAARYWRSFLLTETDGLDATYFILDQLEVIARSIDELHTHLKSKMQELRATESLITDMALNNRQVALLGHALRNPDADFTYVSHARSHRVVRQSARRDILDLETAGFLERRLVGATVHFRPVPDLTDRVGQGGR